MKSINIKFVNKKNKLSTVSNFRSEDSDFDIINFFTQCVNTLEEVKDFKRLIFKHGKTYDHNVLNVDIYNKTITITTVADDIIDIPKDFLQEMINDWENFLKNKKAFTKEYFI